MANNDEKQQKIPKLKRTDSRTIDPRMPWTQENFINETTSILKNYDESLKRQREDDIVPDKAKHEPEVKKKKD